MWIKCSDKLPPLEENSDTSKNVLVTDGTNISIGYFLFDAFGDYRCYNEWDLIPTHWMPLPAPPKECEFSCGNCKHFYYSEMVQGGSCWGEENAAKKRNANDKICELFISNK